ncbi:MAG: nicotinate-nucleotide adenylyltransferase [Streptococcaceae bacterium]|jgi:nicotinate-nucleotide adenylyltransferase|nr:nicotinate-nucleotide adenylyltransferase [Streptococcaceae bacterium]
MELLTPFTKVKIEVMPDNLNRRQVGILGGNFNPIHQAHLVVADQVKQQLGLDEVLLMPEYLPPHVDTKATIPAFHRAKMIELAIEDYPGLSLETIELKRQGVSFTYETMKLLTDMHPDIDYYFIIGGDMVAYLPKWHQIDRLVEMCQFVGVERPGFKIGTSYPVIWVDVPKQDISSTKIRDLIRRGNVPNFLVPKKVLNYIYQQGLYINV